MVEISLSGSGEGPGWVTAPGYSTAAFFECPITRDYVKQAEGFPGGYIVSSAWFRSPYVAFYHF